MKQLISMPKSQKLISLVGAKLGRRRQPLISSISQTSPEIIAIAHPNFRGVRSATYELVKDVIEVKEIYSRQAANWTAKKILAHKPIKVLISGYAIGYDLLASELKKLSPELRIFVLIHSSFIWFDTQPAENYVFENFIRLARSGAIEKVGFCKRDLAEYFKGFGVNTFFVMNRFYPEDGAFHKLDRKNIKVGVFGQNIWHRNITNQVIGALMIKDTTVHVNEVSDHFFIDKKRVKIHGFLPKPDFLKLYKTMDVNMYVSMTDCFPMSIIESMQYGIPCLASDTSDVYSLSPKLKEWLTVSTVDGPIGVSQKLESVLDNYEAIQKEIKNYLPVLKGAVEKSIEDFLK